MGVRTNQKLVTYAQKVLPNVPEAAPDRLTELPNAVYKMRMLCDPFPGYEWWVVWIEGPRSRRKIGRCRTYQKVLTLTE
jgi:hypothetical protein